MSYRYITIRCVVLPMKRIFVIIFAFIQIVSYTNAQIKSRGIPFVQNYSTNTYQAGTQNFQILEDQRGIMYFANSRGILEYDGATWNLIQTSKKTAAGATNNRIYVGAKDDFGYLAPSSNGQMEFISLLDLIPTEHQSFSRIRYMFMDKDGVYFLLHKKKKIFRYKNNKYRYRCIY